MGSGATSAAYRAKAASTKDDKRDESPSSHGEGPRLATPTRRYSYAGACPSSPGSPRSVTSPRSHREADCDSPKSYFSFASPWGGRGRPSPEEQAQDFLSFYRGSGTDCHGRTLHDIMHFSDKELETAHNYIQWLFPSDTASGYNLRAPALTHELQEEMLADELVMRNLLKSFDLFLKFLGFEYVEVTREVRRTSDFKEKARNWLSSSPLHPNHNWLRCSRVLHCMTLLKEIPRRDAFYEALEEVYVEGLISPQFSKTMEYWQKAADRDKNGIPAQEAPFMGHTLSGQSHHHRRRRRSFITR